MKTWTVICIFTGFAMLLAVAAANSYAAFFMPEYTMGMGFASAFWTVIGTTLTKLGLEQSK